MRFRITVQLTIAGSPPLPPTHIHTHLPFPTAYPRTTPHRCIIYTLKSFHQAYLGRDEAGRVENIVERVDEPRPLLHLC